MKDAVFTSQQVSKLTVQEIERRRANKNDGIFIKIPLLEEDLLPLRPGELTAVLGRPSNYKSGVMAIIARDATEQIKDNEDDVILYVTWEQSIEEHGLIELANASRIDASKMARGDLTDAEWAAMMKAAVRRGTTPLWLIGHSSQAGKRRPRLSMTDLASALAYIVDEAEKRPRLIVLDYLQRIRPDSGNTQREKMMEIVDRAKDLALSFSVPVVLGTQAGRQVDERAWKLPQMADSQETSNLEQSADKMLAVWMPKTSELLGDTVGKNPAMEVTEDLLYLSILKQKFGVAPRIYALKVEPQINKISRRIR